MLFLQSSALAALAFVCVLILYFSSHDEFSASIRSFGGAIPHNQALRGERVAICLVGGSRAFELTGPSISKFLLNNNYSNADVFLHVPLDVDTFKLFLLKSTLNFAAAKIFRQQLFVQEAQHNEVLGLGCQPLLQYFDLVEGCVGLIEAHEERHKFKYEWIIRTRLDGYWSGPLPPLHNFNRSAYTTPSGNVYTGLNDRFGLGDRSSSMAALRRLSMVTDMHKKGYRSLNSEGALKAQLDMTNKSYTSVGVPFCVLTAKRFAWPLVSSVDMPVMALTSRGPLNGAYCRPCVAALVGEQAVNASELLGRGWSWIGDNDGVEVCDNSEDDLEKGFDAVAGDDARLARLLLTGLGRSECIRRMEAFRKRWEIWDAPEPRDICSEKFGRTVEDPGSDKRRL